MLLKDYNIDPVILKYKIALHLTGSVVTEIFCEHRRDLWGEGERKEDRMAH